MGTEATRYSAYYVKVHVRARSAKRWAWSLYQEGSDVPVDRSAELFGCAEDAWRSGQAALRAREAEHCFFSTGAGEASTVQAEWNLFIDVE